MGANIRSAGTPVGPVLKFIDHFLAINANAILRVRDRMAHHRIVDLLLYPIVKGRLLVLRNIGIP
jgi:predicted lysophospholipase L1 biosynthesis ABC-type transport system permease subunit